MSRVVITRRLGEAITIEAADTARLPVVVRVIGVAHGNVRISVDAPEHVRVRRDPYRVPKEELR